MKKQIEFTNVTDALIVTNDTMMQMIDNHFPSIYTKDDVKKLIEQYTDIIGKQVLMIPSVQSQEASITTELLKNMGLEKWLKNQIADNLEDELECVNWRDHIEIADQQFSISYNNVVELDDWDVSIETDKIAKKVADNLAESIISNLDTLTKEDEVNQ